MEETFVYLLFRLDRSDDYRSNIVAVYADETIAEKAKREAEDLLDPDDIWDSDIEYYINKMVLQ